MEIDLVNDTFTPITDETFVKQGWERHDEQDGDDEFYWWQLPLPKENPDKNARCLISTTSDQWEEYGLREGEYTIEIFDFTGLGFCMYEEDIEDLYAVLTKSELMDDLPLEDGKG